MPLKKAIGQLPLPARAIKKIEANPINIAVILIEKQDSASVISTCEYYGYPIEPGQNSNMVFRYENGSSMYVSFNDSDNSKKGY